MAFRLLFRLQDISVLNTLWPICVICLCIYHRSERKRLFLNSRGPFCCLKHARAFKWRYCFKCLGLILNARELLVLILCLPFCHTSAGKLCPSLLYLNLKFSSTSIHVSVLWLVFRFWVFPICTLDLWLEESVAGCISFTLQFIMLTIFVYLFYVLVLKKTMVGVFIFGSKQWQIFASGE